jgi:hypothetical protein
MGFRAKGAQGGLAAVSQYLKRVAKTFRARRYGIETRRLLRKNAMHGDHSKVLSTRSSQSVPK